MDSVSETLIETAEPVEDFDLSDQNGVLKKKWGIGFWIAMLWILAMAFLAIFANALPIDDPSAQRACKRYEAPSADHFLGCDNLGRDMFARTIAGARTSLTVGFAAIAFGMVVGGTLGIIAGYFKGWRDKVISFLFLVELSFPALILAILLTSFLSRDLQTVALTLGILSVAPIGRLARAATLQVSEREFVTAARGLGAKPTRIMIKEILPNVVMPMFALALLAVAIAIVAEGTLAYLGLSVAGNNAISWGTIIADGTSGNRLKDAPHIAMSAVGALFITVLALNYIGDRVRQRMEIKELPI